MKRHKQARKATSAAVLLSALVLATGGCATKGRSGALIGGGLGAIIGQATGGDTEGTLIGSAVGTGIGYIVGNEMDKKEAERLSEQGDYQPEPSALTDTSWRVVSLVSDKPRTDKSIVVEFRGNGRVITTKTKPDGSVTRNDERYRVVGQTLIVNKPGYMINARYRIDGDEMILDADRFSAVLNRL